MTGRPHQTSTPSSFGDQNVQGCHTLEENDIPFSCVYWHVLVLEQKMWQRGILVIVVFISTFITTLKVIACT